MNDSTTERDGSSWEILHELYFDLLAYVLPGGLGLIECYWIARTAGLLRRGLFMSYVDVWPFGFLLAFLAASYASGQALAALARIVTVHLLRLAPRTTESERAQEAAVRVRSGALRRFLAKRYATEVLCRSLTLVGVGAVAVFIMRYRRTGNWVDCADVAGTTVLTLALLWRVRSLGAQTQRDVAALSRALEPPPPSRAPRARG